MPISQFPEMNNLPEAPKFDAHVWVDFVELLCLVNIDRIAARGDVLDRVRSYDKDLPAATDPDEEVSPDTDETADSASFSEMAPAEINDRWAGYADGWFQHLLYRSGAFRETYPFTLTNTADVLQLKENLTAAQKLYIFLLLCANLRYFKQFENDLTVSFEQLSKEVMKSFFSERSEVHIFGTSETNNRRYAGNLYQKILKLAEDLGDTAIVKESSLSSSNSGDGGLDIVAWISLGDLNSHRIVVFGQCACTDKWDEKQFSSTAERWRGYLLLRSGVVNIIFIPHCLRRASGDWHQKEDISNVMVDRQRFLFSLTDKESLLETKSAYQVVQQVITESEDIY